MVNKTISKIQFAIRARQCAMGDQLIKAVQSGKAKLVIYSSACGENRKKKLNDKCASFHVPVLEMSDEEFSQISSRPLMSIAILDKNFADGILKDMKG